MKLSQLTPQDKIKLAAELDGWTYPCKSCEKKGTLGRWRTPADGSCIAECDLPAYDTSYDAIIPLVQKQDEEIQILVELKVGVFADKRVLSVTPSQLLDALLVATGKAEL